MPPSTSIQRIYRSRLSRWATTFSHGGADLRPSEIDADSDLSQVRLFVSENIQKRSEKIAALTSLLEDSFDAYSDSIDRFVRSIPAQPCAGARCDALRYLEWLAAHYILNPEQRDCLICEHSRLRVEELARQRRLDYVRFAELRSVLDSQLQDLPRDSQRRLVVNPTRVWSLLATRRFVGDSTPLPATVLFLAVDEDHRTCLLDETGRDVVRQIERNPGGSFQDLQEALGEIAPDRLEEHCGQLAEQGILAIE